MPDVFAVNRQTKKRNYGVPCEPAVLQDLNSVGSILWESIFSISIVLPQSCLSSWMGLNMDYSSNISTMRYVNNFSRQRGSKNCVFGTISGGQAAKPSS